MTPARLIECQRILGWSRRGLAAQLGRNEATIRQWEAGKVRIPDEVAEWLESRAQHAVATPPPKGK